LNIFQKSLIVEICRFLEIISSYSEITSDFDPIFDSLKISILKEPLLISFHCPDLFKLQLKKSAGYPYYFFGFEKSVIFQIFRSIETVMPQALRNIYHV